MKLLSNQKTSKFRWCTTELQEGVDNINWDLSIWFGQCGTAVFVVFYI